MGNPQALQAHIVELEELVENLLVDARLGSRRARALAVHIHREAMEKRLRLRELYGKDG